MKRIAALTAVIGLGGAVPAAALQPCPGPAPKTEVLLSEQGLLESVITDAKGRLFFTGPQGLMRLDRRDGEPELLAPVSGGGGLAFDTDGKLLVGYGNTIANGTNGDSTGPSGLLKVDPETGANAVYATGLSMANGLVRGPDGAFYASNDFGSNIDRIAGGKTERGWAKVESGNGLAIDRTGRYLYVAQTFRPAAIQRVNLADPTDITPFAVAGPADTAAGLDGMTSDAAGRLFVVGNGSGELWRADTDGTLCLVLGGLPKFPDGPSAVAVGTHRGTFGADDLYIVTFDGQLIEVQDVATPAPVLKVVAKPPRVRACRRRAVVVTVTAGGNPVVGAAVRFRGTTRSTGPRGRARFAGKRGRPMVHRARATAPGYGGGSAPVKLMAC